MYDLNNPTDIIAQMRDGEMTDPAIVKTLRLTLELFCVMCANELTHEEQRGNVCAGCSSKLPF